VLIVDQSEDTREVLRTALQRQGLAIYEASRATQGLDLARRHRPQVIVLDLEVEVESPVGLYDLFAEQSSESQTSLVVLGSATVSDDTNVYAAADQVVSKPYHYGPLIRRIEELLA
jgi:two-component system KDP operon response regulator KdpE